MCRARQIDVPHKVRSELLEIRSEYVPEVRNHACYSIAVQLAFQPCRSHQQRSQLAQCPNIQEVMANVLHDIAVVRDVGQGVVGPPLVRLDQLLVLGNQTLCR